MNAALFTTHNMANTGGVTGDADMMRYAEYAPKTNAKSEAEIDRRLVSIRFSAESAKPN